MFYSLSLRLTGLTNQRTGHAWVSSWAHVIYQKFLLNTKVQEVKLSKLIALDFVCKHPRLCSRNNFKFAPYRVKTLCVNL